MGFISTLRRLLKRGARHRPQHQDHARSEEHLHPPDAHATTQPRDDPLPLSDPAAHIVEPVPLPEPEQTPPSITPAPPAVPAPVPPRAPPFRRFPAKFPVGIHTYDPFVSVEDLQLNLRFLRAFHQLRKKVEAAEACAPHLSAEERWTAFVRMATRRTGVFLAFARESGPAYRWGYDWILPLDVALVLHATLTSRDILQDQLSGIEDLLDSKLLVQTAKSIDPSTYEQVADAAARRNWRFETGSHFDPLACFVSHIGQDILGTHGFPSVSVRWLRPDGTGFAEPGFVHKDDAWHGPTLTHEVHGVIKFAQDLWDCMSAPEKAIRGTRHPNFKLPDFEDCAKPWAWIAEQLVDDTLVESATSAWDVAERLGWRRKGVHELLKRHLGSAEISIQCILSCYADGESLSHDIAATVRRQQALAAKLDSVGWLEGRADLDDASDPLLRRAIARYHALLDLARSTSQERYPRTTVFRYVTTLDIELARSAHQLLYSYRYVNGASGSYSITGAVESGEPDTVAALQNTAQAWQARFNTPYITCGCALPALSPTAEQRTWYSDPKGDVFVYARRVLTPPEEEAFVTHPSALDAEGWETHVRCVWESGEARKCCGDGGADDEGGEGLPAYEREGGTVEE